MQRATLGKSGSKKASQLQGRTARAFSSNILVETMGITVVIQYILTVTQSFGSQNYCKKSRLTIHWFPGVFTLRERAGTDKMDYRMFQRKYLLGCFFSVSVSQSIVFSGRLCSKASQHILDIVGLSQIEV